MKIKIIDKKEFHKISNGVIYDVMGRLGDYFIQNDKGGVYWIDDLGNDGAAWEYLK